MSRRPMTYLPHLVPVLILACGVSAQANLLTNGDFEQDLSVGWTVTGTGLFGHARREFDVDRQSNVLHVYRKLTGSKATVTQTVQLDRPVTECVFSGDAKLRGSDNWIFGWGAAQILLAYLDGAGTHLGSTTILGRVPNFGPGDDTFHIIYAPNDDWNSYSIPFDTEFNEHLSIDPTQVSSIKVVARVVGGGLNSHAELWADNLSIGPGSPPVSPPKRAHGVYGFMVNWHATGYLDDDPNTTCDESKSYEHYTKNVALPGLEEIKRQIDQWNARYNRNVQGVYAKFFMNWRLIDDPDPGDPEGSFVHAHPGLRLEWGQDGRAVLKENGVVIDDPASFVAQYEATQNWDHHDTLIRAIRDKGFKLYPIVGDGGGAPPAALGPAGQVVIDEPLYLAHLYVHTRAVVEHFFQERWIGAGEPNIWQIENELNYADAHAAYGWRPGSVLHWSNGAFQRAVARTLRAAIYDAYGAHAAKKPEDACAPTVALDLHAGYHNFSVPFGVSFPFALDERGLAAYADVVALNDYACITHLEDPLGLDPGYIEDATKRGRDLVQAVRQAGFKGPVWIAGTTIPSRASNIWVGHPEYSEGRQAQYLQNYVEHIRLESTDHPAGFVWYQLADSAGLCYAHDFGVLPDPESYAGLLRNDLTPKKLALNAFLSGAYKLGYSDDPYPENPGIVNGQFQDGLGGWSFDGTVETGQRIINGLPDSFAKLIEGSDALLWQDLAPLPNQGVQLEFRFASATEGDKLQVFLDGVLVYEASGLHYLGDSFYVTPIVGGPGAYSRLEIRLSSDDVPGGEMWVDNVRFIDVVPEPMSVTVLMSGLLVLFRRRARHKRAESRTS